MPIYEFFCESCQKISEYLVLKTCKDFDLYCPQCNGDSLSRVVSSCNVVVGGTSILEQSITTPQTQNRFCGKGSCSTITLPGKTK